MSVRFDDSLPLLATLLVAELGMERVVSGVSVRDATGRLAFYVRTTLDEQERERVSLRMKADLGQYARSDRAINDSTDAGASRVLESAATLMVLAESVPIKLLDLRLVGADWLRVPQPAAPPPVRFVFASLKGGVGRSTALCVAAVSLAAAGRRVLTIDLDMEAPGLGAMLLDDETLPEFGLLDALVENGIGGLDDRFLADMVSPTALAQRRGAIDVVPAFGKRSRKNPADVLSKIARAYVEDVAEDGTVSSILDQIRSIVDRFSDPLRYDAILIDARAGLHETTAAAISGLGAEVFLFGLDEPQTFQGYDVLLAHLSRFAPTSAPVPDWLNRITIVQGKAPFSAQDRAGFAERCLAMYQRAGLLGPSHATSEVQIPAEPFNAVPWADSVGLGDEDVLPDDRRKLPEPVAIFEDERFRNFNPAGGRDVLAEEIYLSVYGAFLQRVNIALAETEGGIE